VLNKTFILSVNFYLNCLYSLAKRKLKDITFFSTRSYTAITTLETFYFLAAMQNKGVFYRLTEVLLLPCLLVQSSKQAMKENEIFTFLF